MKGISYTLEAIIATILLLFSLIVYFKPLPVPEAPEIRYKAIAYNGLKILDEAGRLRSYALDNNASAIRTDLATYISYLDYDVTIYDRASNLTAIPSITAEDVISVSYFLAGDVGNYSAKEVRVFLWGFD